MIIKSIKLNNIRSYLNQEINFPTGSVLLSGDIGSGKSTILLATEFALFGIRRKHLSGESLLRNGKKQGSVELHFSIDGKDYVIKRSLKRYKDEVKQEAGYVLINDVKKEGTHIELKSFILEVLGYPKELLTKTKNLVYRYTVYTPQEEMKQILFDEEENRLDTLRKVFGIDNYKRIRENALIYLRELKQRIKEFEGRIFDIDEKQKQKGEQEKEIKQIDLKINSLKPNLEKYQKEIKTKKAEIEIVEEKIKELRRTEKDLELCDITLQNKLEQRRGNSETIDALKKQIEQLQKEIPSEKVDIKKISEDIELDLQLLEQLEKELDIFGKKKHESQLKINQSESLKRRILELNQCPTCDQKVEDKHKEFITGRENKNIAILKKDMHKIKEDEQKAQQQIIKIRDYIEKMRKQEKDLAVFDIKIKNFDEKTNQIKKLKLEQDKIKQDIGSINIKKKELSEKIPKFEGIDEDYKIKKNKLEQLQEKEKKLALEVYGLDTSKENIQKQISLLEKEIREKLKIKEEINDFKQLQEWIEKFFINLMTTIEKQVMLRVYHEFNELFQNWFSILIEDETINVRLDDQFTPVIEQNGYEIDISHLSGGEKTSCALAYRLALNKVINDMIETIKTKDLIILDEPTDGFSMEQLDKIRDVLDQLKMNQVIIVSHEAKIESFVQNVIRINKEEHVSGIISQ